MARKKREHKYTVSKKYYDAATGITYDESELTDEQKEASFNKGRLAFMNEFLRPYGYRAEFADDT